jgi:hypothetical protein
MTARIDDDDDFMLAAEPRPAKRAQRGPGKGRRSATRRWAWLNLLTRRPARTIMGAIVTALLTSIVINALVLQKVKHPAPLFMPTQPSAAPAPHMHPASAGQAHVQAPAADNAPVEAKQRDTIAALLKPNSVEKPAGETAPPLPATRPKDTIAALLKGNTADKARPEKEPAEAKSKDVIGALLKTNNAAAAGAAEPSSATVAAAQQALVRLGFVLRADGVLGASTRQAIELFQRDHRMEVDGDLSPRVTRQLSAMSGLAIP